VDPSPFNVPLGQSVAGALLEVPAEVVDPGVLDVPAAPVVFVSLLQAVNSTAAAADSAIALALKRPPRLNFTDVSPFADA
jgi:hypothetical protein